MSDEEPTARTSSERMARRLAAILSADVKGYSRLMGEDELATVRTLTAYREVMTTLIHAHRGRFALTFTHKCQLLSNLGRLYKFPAFAKERGKEAS